MIDVFVKRAVQETREFKKSSSEKWDLQVRNRPEQRDTLARVHACPNFTVFNWEQENPRKPLFTNLVANPEIDKKTEVNNSIN